MDTVTCCQSQPYFLRFEPLVTGEAVIDVPCGASGRVDLDALAEAERNAYFYARVVHCGRFAARIVPLNSY